MVNFENLTAVHLEWLRGAQPIDWHRSVLTFNFDADLAPLVWIASQPRCDLGTAITIYYMGQPDFFAQYDSMAEIEAQVGYELPTAELLELIANSVSEGLYRDANLKPYIIERRNEKAGTPPWHVPSALRNPKMIGLDVLPVGFIEGLPSALLKTRMS